MILLATVDYLVNKNLWMNCLVLTIQMTLEPYRTLICLLYYQIIKLKKLRLERRFTAQLFALALEGVNTYQNHKKQAKHD